MSLLTPKMFKEVLSTLRSQEQSDPSLNPLGGQPVRGQLESGNGSISTLVGVQREVKPREMYNNPRGPPGHNPGPYYGGHRGPYPPPRGPRPRQEGHGYPVGGRPRGPSGPRGSVRPNFEQARSPETARPTGGAKAPVAAAEPTVKSPTQGLTPIPPRSEFDGAGADQISNDCEIIIFDKAQQAYGESIEKSLRDLGFKVDIMFPKPEVLGKLTVLMEALASNGAIFAIVIRPDNQERQSVTVHVLRGVKIELHRNMPLHIAYKMMRDRFDDFKNKAVGSVTPEMKELLEKISSDAYLNDNQYSSVIHFLKQRRRRQLDFEFRKPRKPDEKSAFIEDLIKRQEMKKLQTKILDWLNEVGKGDSTGNKDGTNSTKLV